MSSLATTSPALKGINLGLHALGTAVSFGIVYATWAFVVAPMQGQHEAMVNQLADGSAILGRSSAIHSKHDEVSQQLTNFEATFARLMSRIPETPRESEFLAQVTELARSCQLRIQRYHPRDPVNEGTHTALEVQLDATAGYAGICRFLDGLRTTARLCRVTRLRVHADGTDGVELPIELTLRIYFAPLTKTAAREARHG
jgi:Tfp pilus assembly protein PilO